MSLQSQLTRLARNVGALTADTNAIFEALRAKGVNVPANAQLSDVADMIEEIEVPPSNIVTIGGRDYPYVQIGNQYWLAENLDYKWSGLVINPGVSSTSSSYAYYYNNNETDYGIDGTYKCGLLYNWSAVNYLETNKSTLLPTGWHVPTKSELEDLILLAGNVSTKLKALNNTILSNWPSGWNGTDDYGLSLIPTGMFYYSQFNYFGTANVLWTSTKNSNTNAYYMWVPQNTNIPIGVESLDNAFSLRLVKDVT